MTPLIQHKLPLLLSLVSKGCGKMNPHHDQSCLVVVVCHAMACILCPYHLEAVAGVLHNTVSLICRHGGSLSMVSLQ